MRTDALQKQGIFQRLCRTLSYPWRVGRKLLVRQQALLQLEERMLQLEKNHQASINWLHQVYPEIVEAIGKKVEQDQLDRITRDLFAGLREQATAMRAISSGGEAIGELSIDPCLYIDLENSFRGTPDEVRASLQHYLGLLQEQPARLTPVLDIGCGRGEWLTLLRESGFVANGVDSNPVNGIYCRSRGLDVVTADALSHLESLPDNSVGVVTAFHLAEHLPFNVLVGLTDRALKVLKPGGLLVYETPNPENLLVATRTFWIDPTHLRPLPVELLEFLVAQRGLKHLETRRLHPETELDCTDVVLKALLSAPRDYAVIAQKPYLPESPPEPPISPQL